MEPGEASSRPRGRAAGARRRTATATRRRRAAAALGALAAGSALIGAITGAGGGGATTATTNASEPIQLPRGGTVLLPDMQLVGYYGAPQDEALGALGIGSPARAAGALERQARAYEGSRPVQPFLELLASVANADPGDDGLYRTQQPRPVIDDYLAQARASRDLLVLDIQPGRADFAAEVARLGPYLRQPDVGLALDPEWHVGAGEVPGQVIGSMSAAEVNEIAAGLSRIVTENRLPQKLLIVHRFTAEMITGAQRLRSYPGVAVVLNVDGFGTPEEKVAKYDELRAPRGSGLFSGFKLFYNEDVGLMPPPDVLALKPRPDLVVYE